MVNLFTPKEESRLLIVGIAMLARNHKKQATKFRHLGLGTIGPEREYYLASAKEALFGYETVVSVLKMVTEHHRRIYKDEH
jgi:hypothetical protein